MKPIVVKDNALINASYNLDLVEQRLILLAIVEARESGKGINADDPLTVHAESYASQFGTTRQASYLALKDACEDLFARQFSYQKINARGNIENYKSRWVSEIGYIENEAVVKLIFAPAIVPLITRLEEQFTKYELQQISNLTSAYAVRLYELLIAWRSSGQTPIIELSEFRQKMGVLEKEYTRSDNFKKWIIEQPIQQINKYTDITVKCEQHKKGRSISGFSFTFKQKKSLVKPTKNAEITLEERALKMTIAQRHFFANKLCRLPELGKYSQGTEGFDQFAVRIAEQLSDPVKLKEYLPYLKQVGFTA